MINKILKLNYKIILIKNYMYNNMQNNKLMIYLLNNKILLRLSVNNNHKIYNKITIIIVIIIAITITIMVVIQKQNENNNNNVINK